MIKVLFTITIILATVSAFSQKVIKGKILDSKDSTEIPLVSVNVKGTNLSTLTMADGTFILTISDSIEKTIHPLVLLINYVGYNSIEFQIGEDSSYSLSFFINQNSIQEISVIGYGSTDKRELVSFPWPPPDFSTRVALDRNLFNGANTIGDVDSILSKALKQLGYESAYFYIPNGYAMVTRIEQIRENGETLPSPERWSANTRPMTGITWKNYLKYLFFSTSGYFRIIVFTVTNKTFNSSGKKVKKETAIKWLNEGLNVLPFNIKKIIFREDYICTALIYEFEVKSDSNEPFLHIPSLIPAQDHLERAKIIEALRRR